MTQTTTKLRVLRRRSKPWMNLNLNPPSIIAAPCMLKSAASSLRVVWGIPSGLLQGSIERSNRNKILKKPHKNKFLKNNNKQTKQTTNKINRGRETRRKVDTNHGFQDKRSGKRRRGDEEIKKSFYQSSNQTPSRLLMKHVTTRTRWKLS